jgi:hypothetical protein
MSWPSGIDYRDALQHPDRVFALPELRGCKVETNHLGVPRPRSGASAQVYRFRNGSHSSAVRVFLHPSEERERRYQAVHDHLQRVRLGSLVRFTYHAQGMLWGSGRYPVLLMDWVEGVSLREWMRERLRQRDLAAVRDLAGRWVTLIRQLRTAGIAHGDLQHDNVMVVGQELRLVDYDGMCVPALVGEAALEDGLPGYQHPSRKGQKLSPGLDHFSAWIIFLALRAVVAEPALWDDFVDKAQNDNLLFRVADLTEPATSPLWGRLLSSPDADVQGWAKQLRALLPDAPFDAIPSFEPDPFAELRQAASARPKDWQTVLRLAPANGPPLPHDLGLTILEARRRDQARRALELALKDGDPRVIVTAYDPALLDDWPACADMVRQAKQARELTHKLDEVLGVLHHAGPGPELARLWAAHAETLKSFPEAKAVEEALKRWQIAVAGVESELRALAETSPRDWDAIGALADRAGLEPALLPDDLAPVVSESLARRTARDRLKAALEGRSLNAVYKSYQRDLLDDWPACADLLREAKQRLALVPVLNAATRAATTKDHGRSLVELWKTHGEKLLGCDEAIPLEVLAAKWRVRIEACDRFLLAARDPVDDEVIARRWLRLQRAGGHPDAEPFREMAERAGRRLACLARLREIPTTLPDDEQDRLWFERWDDALLSESPSAAPLRPRYDRALRRLSAWQKMEAALRTEDLLHIGELASNPTLIGYPPLRRQLTRIHELSQLSERVREVLLGLERGDRRLFEDPANRDCLRTAEKVFAKHRERVASPKVTWSIGQIRLEAGQPACVINATRTTATIRWSWRASQQISYCLLASNGERCLAIPADAGSNLARVEVQDRARNLGINVPLEPGQKMLHVSVWPVIDLDWVALAGEPLHLSVDLRRV